MTEREKEHDRFLMHDVACDEKLKSAAQANKDLDKKIKEYMDAFHESIPVFMMPQMSTEELIKIIDDCLQSGKPIKVDVDDDPSIIY